MNITKTMFIRHCTNCDSTLPRNHFQEWLLILQAGSKAKFTDTKDYLDLEYVQKGLDCITCVKNGIKKTITMVVFKWYQAE